MVGETTKLDLNLLRVLVVLFETRSVTRSALRLGMSQPGFSSALARLRSQLQDPLFVRTSGGMLPTPRAEQFYVLAAEMLARVDQEVAAPAAFDPAGFEGEFRLAMGDAGEPSVLPKVMNYMQAHAPKARVHSSSPGTEELAGALETGRVELAIGLYPELEGGGFLRQALYRQSFHCLLREGHPIRGPRVEWADLMAYGHVKVNAHSRSVKLLDNFMREHGIELPHSLEVPHFMSLPSIVARTDLLAIVPFAPGVQVSGAERLRLLPLPFDAPVFTIAQHWHARLSGQPKHRWLRSVFYELFHESGRTAAA